MRGFGELEAAAALPDAAVVLAALLTQLADVWFVFVLLGTLYWAGGSVPGPVSLSRDRGAFVVALAVGSLAVVTTLKEWLRYPRPPGAGEAPVVEALPAVLEGVYAGAATADGFGFPSGHALTAVAVYGGLAAVVGTRRAYAAAAAVAASVCLTRIALGVHYLVDVLAGAAAGAALLAVAYRLAGGTKAGRAFGIALVAALVGPVLGGYNFDTMLALGAALGARISWGVVGEAVVHETATPRGGAVSVAVGLGFGGVFGAVYAAEPAPHVAFLVVAVVFGVILAAPLAGEAAARRLR